MSLSARPPAWQTLRKLGLAITVAGSLLAVHVTWAKEPVEGRSALAVVAWAELPAQARATDRLIRAGGPFPHAKDGMVFGNRERILPAKPRGFYREYTVETPGARDRGARRIVCGGLQVTRPDVCFYTDNHYASFRHIVE